MTSNLACVGLSVSDETQLDQLLSAVIPSSVILGRIGDVEIRRWQDPSGARLVMGIESGQVMDLLPSYAGEPGAQLSAVTVVNDDVATGAVVDEDGEQVTALAAEFEQRRFLVGASAVSGRASVVSLAVDAKVFADDDAFSSSDASFVDPGADRDSLPPAHYVEQGWKWPPRMAAESFLSYGVFGDPAHAEAHARLCGTVLSAQTCVATQTGQAFHVARVRTVGFDTDVCLAATDHPQAPAPGQVIAGTVFLVASLAEFPTTTVSKARSRFPWPRR